MREVKIIKDARAQRDWVAIGAKSGEPVLRPKSRAAWRLLDVEVAADGGHFTYTLNRGKLRQHRRVI